MRARAGDWVALLSGLFFAGLILSLRHQRAGGGEAAVTLGNALAAVVLAPLVLGGPPVPPRSAAILLLLGAVQVAGAYALFVRGIRHVPATRAALLGMLEPILNPLWVLLVLGETPRPTAIAGGCIVLGAIAWRSTRDYVSGRGQSARLQAGGSSERRAAAGEAGAANFPDAGA